MSGGICILIIKQCCCCLQDEVEIYENSVGLVVCVFSFVLQYLPPCYPSIFMVVSGLGL